MESVKAQADSTGRGAERLRNLSVTEREDTRSQTLSTTISLAASVAWLGTADTTPAVQRQRSHKPFVAWARGSV